MDYYLFDGTCYVCFGCLYTFIRAKGVKRTGIVNGTMNLTVPMVPRCPRCGGTKVVLNLVDL